MAAIDVAGAFIDSTTLAPKTGLLDVTCTITKAGTLVVNNLAATASSHPGVYTYNLTYDPVADADAEIIFSFSTASEEVTAKTVYGAFTIGQIGGLAQAQAALTAQGYTNTRAGYLDALNGLVASIWGHGSRTLTAFGTLASDVWGVTTRTITGGTVNNIPSVSADVQTGMTNQGYTPARAGYLDALNGIIAAIWAHGTRSLTTFGTLVADVWANTTRTITGGTVSSIPSVQADVEDALDAQGYTMTRAMALDDIGGIPGDVWTEPSRTLTESTGGGATPQEVWEYPDRTLTVSIETGGVDFWAMPLPGNYPPGSAGAKIGSLGGRLIPVQNVELLSSKAVTIHKGDDYAAADGRAIVWEVEGGMDIAGATAVLEGLAEDPITMTVLPSQRLVQLELTADQTAALAAGLVTVRIVMTTVAGRTISSPKFNINII